VEHVRGRYLRVIGETKNRTIAIPEGIEHFDQVLETVSSIRSVRVRSVEQWQKHRAFMAVGLLLYVFMLWTTLPAAVILLSLATGSVIVWVLFWVRRNPNIPGSRKWIAWIYWLLFATCILKLFAAVDGFEGGVKPYAIIGKIVAYTLISAPPVLLTFGWVRWWRVRPPRNWRNYAVALGLAAASISTLCLYGVVSYVQLAHIGHANEHRLAMAGVCVGWPLSVLSAVTAFAGEGRSRVIAGLAGGSLAAVWSVAFFNS
jgi:hypothetical protein